MLGMAQVRALVLGANLGTTVPQQT